MIAVLLALGSAAAYGVSDFFGGLASRRVAALRVVLISYPISAVVIAIAAFFIHSRFSMTSMLFGAASGVVMALAMWWFYMALAEGPMSVVSPLTAVLVAGLPIIVGLALGERPSLVTYAGMALALVAVVLVSREVRDETAGRSPVVPRFTKRVAWFTIGAGLCFALSFIFTHQVEAGTGLWPLVAARGVASCIVFTAALIVKPERFPTGRTLGLAVAVAGLDVIANVTMLYAFQAGLLSVVSVLISLYPAVTVVLAVTVLKERVGKIQILGMGLALTSIAAIAVSG